MLDHTYKYSNNAQKIISQDNRVKIIYKAATGYWTLQYRSLKLKESFISILSFKEHHSSRIVILFYPVSL